MAAEKEELLSKLKEWGVDFETERPKNFDIFQDLRQFILSRVFFLWESIGGGSGCCLLTCRYFELKLTFTRYL